jgi:hypothetical protein
MEWLKIPTDSILYSEFKDEELIILIKYQALYCQLESEPTLAQMSRVFSKKEIKFLQNFGEIVKNLCENQIKTVSKKRNRDKESYKKKQSLSENSASGKLAKSCRSDATDKIRIDNITPLDNKLSISPYRGNELCSCGCKRVAKFEINGSKFCGQHTRIELSKLGRLDLMPRQEKLSFSDVSDWESLFTYWEENKKGGRYKNEESRQRMLQKLKELTGDEFNLAKASICFAIDTGYQGFCNGNELYYKPAKDKPPERTLAQKQREEQLMDEMINRVWKDD